MRKYLSITVRGETQSELSKSKKKKKKKSKEIPVALTTPPHSLWENAAGWSVPRVDLLLQENIYHLEYKGDFRYLLVRSCH
jgi:hypothetical protein